MSPCILLNYAEMLYRQCIFSVFGGRVDVTGEILHGKTSSLSHDGRGVYANLPQELLVTRYHSLAGTHATLPDCLEVSSWISSGPDGGKGIIMGVRHRELIVEGVQFHPESILTAQGRTMLKNFLRMRGGTWAENEKFQTKTNGTSHQVEEPKSVNGSKPGSRIREEKESILERIYRHQRKAVDAQKQIPSQKPSDLQAALDLNLAPPLVSFKDRLRRSPYPLSLMAEIKRASPSKGPIAMSICAPAQARKYALAGASVISVLTEPEWFKGSIDDLRMVRQSLEGMPDRPAVLRKEFIFDEYQILEARVAGADTVLLIVKMLDESTLEKLFRYSRSLGMEPLVEVNTEDEMKTALQLGASVIGVNNRNLTSFEVDLNTTSRLMDTVPKDTFVCALSGISGPDDVKAYKSEGVGGVLVGEALMRSSDVTSFVTELLGGFSSSAPEEGMTSILVKICGTRTAEAARAAIETGADMIGMILVEGRKRCVSTETAHAISEVVHRTKRPKGVAGTGLSRDTMGFFAHSSKFFEHPNRALLVGVFQNQPLSYILEKQSCLDLDIIQLHGSEPIEWASLIPVPVIRRFNPKDPQLGKKGYHALPLLDTAAGGTGSMVDLKAVQECLETDLDLRVILAGGLNPENVKKTLDEVQTSRMGIVAVDVSSGVEEEGLQSVQKIRKFIQAAKGLPRP